MTQLDPAEENHHECDPADLADSESKFSARLRALALQERHKELRLSDCDLEKLESDGHVKEKF